MDLSDPAAKSCKELRNPGQRLNGHWPGATASAGLGCIQRALLFDAPADAGDRLVAG